MEILLFSNDKFLIDFLKGKYATVYTEKNKKENNVIIFDNCDDSFIQKNIEDINIDNKLIINIGNSKIDNLNNFATPFRIMDLYKAIENFKNYYEKNIFVYSYGVLNIDKKHFTNKQNVSFYFTDKEIEILKFLIINKEVTKEELLNNLWDTKVQNIKLVENVIYSLKQKFLSLEIEDFILNKNGVLTLNSV